MNDVLQLKLEEGILTIIISRPEKMNALNENVIASISEAFDEARNNEAVKAVIITGAGEKAFVAGADISQFPEMNGAQGRNLALYGQREVFDKIENFPKPVVAAVNGFALGGGCELAMACHLRLTSETAKFGQPEVNLGLVPGYGGTQRLVHLVGRGKAMELCMTGAMIGAAEAEKLGLVNYVTSPEELLPRTKELLQTILQKAPLSISAVIRLINVATYNASEGLNLEIECFGSLFDTADAKEGAKAFLEKRKAVFTGK